MTDEDVPAYRLSLMDAELDATWPSFEDPSPFDQFTSDRPYPEIRVGEEIGTSILGGLLAHRVKRVVRRFGDGETRPYVETFAWVTLASEPEIKE